MHRPAGEKAPPNNFRLFRVPVGTPQRNRNGESLYAKVDKELASRWEGWDYQIDPTLAIFGQTTRIKDYSRMDFRDSFNSSLLSVDQLKLLDAARLDNLSNDMHPHFVNAIEQISKFPKPGSPQASTLERFPFVCLDGNVALMNLADEPQLRNKLVIGLWEAGVSALQEYSLEVFMRDAHNYREVKDFESVLGWNSPTGVQCWGWN